MDELKEECGIFGIFGHAEASTLTQLGLFALQHRGQEACGIVSSDGTDLHQFRSQGLVADVLNEDVLSKLKGSSAIGHTRYSTTGKNTIKEVQPFAVTVIGKTGGTRIEIAVAGQPGIDCALAEAEQLWSSTLARYFAGRAA